MRETKDIYRKIASIPKGRTFTYSDLDIKKKDYLKTAKALERLRKRGVIKRAMKGVFYKPEQSVFGELKPYYEDQLNNYLFENGKRIAYVTGLALYNQLGLTTQMAARLKNSK